MKHKRQNLHLGFLTMIESGVLILCQRLSQMHSVRSNYLCRLRMKRKRLRMVEQRSSSQCARLNLGLDVLLTTMHNAGNTRSRNVARLLMIPCSVRNNVPARVDFAFHVIGTEQGPTGQNKIYLMSSKVDTNTSNRTA